MDTEQDAQLTTNNTKPIPREQKETRFSSIPINNLQINPKYIQIHKNTILLAHP